LGFFLFSNICLDKFKFLLRATYFFSKDLVKKIYIPQS
jgi:hypothetical protein